MKSRHGFAHIRLTNLDFSGQSFEVHDATFGLSQGQRAENVWSNVLRCHHEGTLHQSLNECIVFGSFCSASCSGICSAILFRLKGRTGRLCSIRKT